MWCTVHSQATGVNVLCFVGPNIQPGLLPNFWASPSRFLNWKKKKGSRFNFLQRIPGNLWESWLAHDNCPHAQQRLFIHPTMELFLISLRKAMLSIQTREWHPPSHRTLGKKVSLYPPPPKKNQLLTFISNLCKSMSLYWLGQWQVPQRRVITVTAHFPCSPVREGRVSLTSSVCWGPSALCSDKEPLSQVICQ